ncbi:hypothetical protein CVT24_003785 [Panaeolus cyanescens]|uniref:Uncharacterized protein n=1 Tax=Panaeolus cyanescens TaxID=181874 RepID=A0A409W843_9AGAR|nr:hypothetical protein CVT24_003785 [Panaeolus cyanescens]
MLVVRGNLTEYHRLYLGNLPSQLSSSRISCAQVDSEPGFTGLERAFLHREYIELFSQIEINPPLNLVLRSSLKEVDQRIVGYIDQLCKLGPLPAAFQKFNPRSIYYQYVIDTARFGIDNILAAKGGLAQLPSLPSNSEHRALLKARLFGLQFEYIRNYVFLHNLGPPPPEFEAQFASITPPMPDSIILKVYCLLECFKYWFRAKLALIRGIMRPNVAAPRKTEWSDAYSTTIAF